MTDFIVKTFESIVLSILLNLTILNNQTIKSENLDFVPNNKVINVVDGDTVDILMDKKVTRVRLIGINTPETKDPRKGVECFGPEASEKLKEILLGKVIELKNDPSQDTEDKYGRLLRYVFLNGENINQKMISDGYAFEYTYKKPYEYQKEFRKSESEAREKNLGLWNKEVCNYWNLLSLSIKIPAAIVTFSEW